MKTKKAKKIFLLSQTMIYSEIGLTKIIFLWSYRQFVNDISGGNSCIAINNGFRYSIDNMKVFSYSVAEEIQMLLF